MANLTIIKFNVPRQDKTVQILTSIQLIYGIPSWIFMLFFLFYLGISNNYVNSFYRLVQLDLLVNIFCYINTWLAIRLENEYAGVEFLDYVEHHIPNFMTISKFFATWFLHMQVWSAGLLCVHRLSAVSFTTSVDKFWANRYYLFGILGIAYSSVWMIPYFINGHAVSVVNPNGTLYKVYNMDQVAFLRVANAISATLYFLIIMVLGVCTTISLAKQLEHVQIDDRGITKRITRIAITYCFILSGILFYNVVMGLEPFLNFLPAPYTQINNVFMVTASDLMTLALPYILIIFDENVRQGLIGRVANNRLFSSNIIRSSFENNNH